MCKDMTDILDKGFGGSRSGLARNAVKHRCIRNMNASGQWWI
jgi:hypothetical protein